jgi:hypothetical protein
MDPIRKRFMRIVFKFILAVLVIVAGALVLRLILAVGT